MRDNSRILFIINSFFPIYLVLVLIVVGIPVATYHYFVKDLSTKDRIMNRNNTGLVLLDRDNKPFFSFYNAKSIEDTSINKIPLHVQEAVIAIEDKDFYKHEGFSLWGIARSIVENLQHKDIVSGGSTITQQLVKNALLSSQKSFLRKYQEIVLAQELERRYSKKEILEMYLNSIYFGEGAFGIKQAAKTYFNKDISQLTIAEGALLAGILPAPSRYSPISGDKNEAKERQILVLQKMQEYGYISSLDYSKAKKESLRFNKGSGEINTIAPHFALWIKQQLIDRYGEERIIRSGFQVKTTLNQKWQRYAEQVVKEQVTSMKDLQVSNGAVVVIEPHTRAVEVMVGSVNWNEGTFGKFNVAVTPRQPGSSFKPILYATALEKGVISPATILKDAPTIFEGTYRPLDYDRKFRGNVTVRRALSNSLNIPAVEVLEMLGVSNVLDGAAHFGIDTLKDSSAYGPSLALGTGEIPLIEMTNAYATLADKGIFKDPVSILSIQDKFENTIYAYKLKERTAVSPQTAFMISSILSDNTTRSEAFGNILTIPRTAAVKTGTTDDYKDAWTIGYTPDLTVGVWIGNNDNKPMDSVPGSIGAAPIWKSLIQYYHKGKPNKYFDIPPGVVSVRLCKNGYVMPPGMASISGYTEYFKEGTEPTIYCVIEPSVTSGAGQSQSQ